MQLKNLIILEKVETANITSIPINKNMIFKGSLLGWSPIAVNIKGNKVFKKVIDNPNVINILARNTVNTLSVNINIYVGHHQMNTYLNVNIYQIGKMSKKY